MEVRSALNERLVAIAAQKKRARLVPWFGGLAAAAACLACTAVFVPRSVAPAAEPSESIEAALTSAHSQAVTMAEDDLSDLLVDEVEL